MALLIDAKTLGEFLKHDELTPFESFLLEQGIVYDIYNNAEVEDWTGAELERFWNSEMECMRGPENDENAQEFLALHDAFDPAERQVNWDRLLEHIQSE
jgi:hypothetical protein